MMCSSVPGGVGGSSGGASEQQQQLTIVPPGFRFHPTDEELLYYYLKKKVSYEVIDLNVIRDVDLNKIEPWDLKEKCSIGSGPQNEWYFFSHKDKKYPTGTRTNRATNAGFWKATGRDKAIHDHQTNSSSSSSSNNRIGMRKTLVFYTGRAPHGQKTDWIMHEYRLIENDHQNFVHSSDQLHYQLQEDGWVVCRVFKKRTHQRGFQHEVDTDHQQHPLYHHQVKFDHMNIHVDCPSNVVAQSLHHHQQQLGQDGARDNNSNFHQHHQYHDFSNLIDSNMHLPHLLSEEQQRSSTVLPPVSLLQQVISMNNIDIESSHNLLKLASSSNINNNNNVNICGGSSTVNGINDHKKDDNNNNSCRFNGDWSFLDKLLASHRHQSFGSSDQHQN